MGTRNPRAANGYLGLINVSYFNYRFTTNYLYASVQVQHNPKLFFHTPKTIFNIIPFNITVLCSFRIRNIPTNIFFSHLAFSIRSYMHFSLIALRWKLFTDLHLPRQCISLWPLTSWQSLEPIQLPTWWTSPSLNPRPNLLQRQIDIFFFHLYQPAGKPCGRLGCAMAVIATCSL